ncbi:uncharacterized protein LOC62_01G000991 [Vanrija pseudolonga]|uniref:Uncharacterized protein n=1 Tax=Vanrija pseudolonga TaxID=143232 RepID=A0AAF1BFF8_9TREE|nr:hypothetical protein LOC62_01G000991 [Vanrija pseudolonga]
MEVISLYWMDIGVDCWELNPQDLSWLDEFDEVPFSDLPELFDTGKAIATKPAPPSLPRRVMVEQRPEVEDWNIEAPVGRNRSRYTLSGVSNPSKSQHFIIDPAFLDRCASRLEQHDSRYAQSPATHPTHEFGGPSIGCFAGGLVK